MYAKDDYFTFKSYEGCESGEEEVIMTKQEGEGRECEFKREIVAERVEEKKDVEVVREDKELARLGLQPIFMRAIRRQGNDITHTGADGLVRSCIINKELSNV